MTIYSTYCDGRTYIAVNHHFLGTVETYKSSNCCCPNWGAMSVNFGGKMRSVNKESYRSLVSSLFGRQIENMADYANFQEVVRAVPYQNYGTFMRNAISAGHRERLFHKLAKAISTGDTEKAVRYIGKGADIQTFYKELQGVGPAFGGIGGALERDRDYNITVFEGNPLQQAILKNLNLVVAQLEIFGAKLGEFGTEYNFYRTVQLEWSDGNRRHTPTPPRMMYRNPLNVHDDTANWTRVFFKKGRNGIEIKKVRIN